MANSVPDVQILLRRCRLINMNLKKHIVPFLIVVLTFILDFYTKSLALVHLANFRKIDFLNGFLRFDLTFNRGGVFGILQGYKNLFLIASIVVLLLMVAYYFYESAMPRFFRYAMAFIIGGAAGNITDRLIPGRIGVVDFISIGVDDVFRWYTFNVADMAIVMGAIVMAIVLYLEERKNKQEKS